jgi:thiamine biosynthesis lipoprotein ApbE
MSFRHRWKIIRLPGKIPVQRFNSGTAGENAGSSAGFFKVLPPAPAKKLLTLCMFDITVSASVDLTDS